MLAGLCIFTAGAMVRLPDTSFTLAWTHSIEKVRWEEDYRVVGEYIEAPLARVKGSGAGMEPPDGAVLKNGWWQYRPVITRHRELRLTRSPYAADYEICMRGACRSLSDVAPQTEGVTRIVACASTALPAGSGGKKH
ncbi:MAG: DUF1850 domain-containing protein [Betaproteobacteria bacterium]